MDNFSKAPAGTTEEQTEFTGGTEQVWGHCCKVIDELAFRVI
ncbi:hypothetical protein ACZ87_02155, partial [Candidatus Erwinia dacicola]